MKYPIGSRIVDAVYTEQKRAISRGNPLVEALPDNPDDRELINSLLVDIPMDEMDGPGEIYERKECIQDLTHVFIPIGQMLEVSRKVMLSIKEGYITRNPLNERFRQDIGALQRAAARRDSSFRSIPGTNANSCGFCLIGDSGMGKTSVINHTLSLIPQVIEHTSYHGSPFAETQLVWLKIECPHDASIKGLCIDFFTEYDLAINDNTRQRFATGRANQDDMISNMAYLARRKHLGLLVIDEIQHISSAKAGGAQRMKNLLTQLVNKLGIPIILVGTPAAIAILSTDLITIRRSCGQLGLSYLRALGCDTLEWDTFLKRIWKYQWVRKRADRSRELTDLIHDYTKGNLDATIKLFMETQRIAIDTGVEEINKETIRMAAQSQAFNLVLKEISRESKAAENIKKNGKSNDGAIAALLTIEAQMQADEKRAHIVARPKRANGTDIEKSLNDLQYVSEHDEY